LIFPVFNIIPLVVILFGIVKHSLSLSIIFALLSYLIVLFASLSEQNKILVAGSTFLLGILKVFNTHSNWSKLELVIHLLALLVGLVNHIKSDRSQTVEDNTKMFLKDLKSNFSIRFFNHWLDNLLDSNIDLILALAQVVNDLLILLVILQEVMLHDLLSSHSDLSLLNSNVAQVEQGLVQLAHMDFLLVFLIQNVPEIFHMAVFSLSLLGVLVGVQVSNQLDTLDTVFVVHVGELVISVDVVFDSLSILQPSGIQFKSFFESL
jgi:hypothetical protein